MKEEKIEYLSLKPTPEIMQLLNDVQDLDVSGLSRDVIFERATQYVQYNKKTIDFQALLQSINNLPKSNEESIPSSLKIKIINRPLDDLINKTLKDVYEISRIQASFKIKVVLCAYINNLKNSKIQTEDESISKLRLEAISLVLKLQDENIEKLQQVINILKND